MKRILAILALIASAVALYAAAVAPTADPVHPGNYTNKELLRYIADYTQDGYVLATAPAADPVHPGNLTEKELLRYIADYTQQSSGGAGDFLADGSVPMTGALTFSGTTHPGIRLNNLTTTQRDAMTPLTGYTIWNTTTGQAEAYSGSAWGALGSSGNTTPVDLATVYSAPTWTLAAGTDYYGTANGARTIALPASPAEGDEIKIVKLVVSSGPITVTVPSSYRTSTTSTSTSIQLPTGNHQLIYKYANATWQLTDTGVDNEIAKSVFGNPAGSAGLPSFTSDPVVTTMTVDTEAYDATNWDGDLTVPTKDAVRDKINSMSSAGQLIHVFSGNASGSATAWTSMPAAQTFLWGSSGGRSTTTKIDLTNYSQVRFMVNKTTTTAGVAGSILSLKYNTTYSTSDTGYSTIGTSAVQVAIDVSTGYLDTGWIDLAAGAKADVFVTVTGTGGNGSTSPSFGNIVAQFK